MSWLNFIDEQIQKNPNKIVIIDKRSNRKLSYLDLKVEVHSWMNFLKNENIGRGDRVAYYCTNSLEHLTILFACAKLEAVFVPLNFRLSSYELKEIIDQVSPKIIINGEKSKLNLLKKEFFLSEINLIKFSATEQCCEEDSCLNPDLPALILFTSGSSGKPKAVMLHNEMLQTNQMDTAREWKLEQSDIAVIETPFFHTGGYNVFCLPLLSLGGKIIISNKFDANNFYSLDNNDKPTVYFGVPTMFQSLLEDERFKSSDLSHLRFVISGGAYCPEKLIRTYQEKGILFKQGFGLTEVGPNCFLLDDSDALGKIGSIGKPMGASQVRLADENLNDVHHNIIGELLIKGKHLCKGFFENIELFNDSLTDGYYHTGDLAYRDEEGFYYITGRKKDMYISGGENIYPAEVERRIQLHPLISDVVVVPVQDLKWGEVGHAYVRSERKIDIDELRDYLNPLISRYKHPHSIEVINDFPLLANGKVDKVKLKEMANSKTL